MFLILSKAAAVQADGISVVVDQGKCQVDKFVGWGESSFLPMKIFQLRFTALLATAAAAAASQVASGAYEEDHNEQDLNHEAYYGHQHGVPPHYHEQFTGEREHDDLLEQRRIKDRKRYAGMSDNQREAYNAHRRDLYHKQGDETRKRRRERERSRYHSLEGDAKKERNARRAKLERDRYNKLNKEELELRNARRRERSKQKKLKVGKSESSLPSLSVENYRGLVKEEHADENYEGVVPEDSAVGFKSANAAAEVAEQTIGAIMDEHVVVGTAIDVVHGTEDRNEVQI